MGYGETLTKPPRQEDIGRLRAAVGIIENKHLGKYAVATAAQIMKRPPLGSSDPYWENEAACGSLDPEMFFPETGRRAYEARRTCLGCAVRAACLIEAMESSDVGGPGVRGALTRNERLSLRAKLKSQKDTHLALA